MSDQEKEDALLSGKGAAIDIEAIRRWNEQRKSVKAPIIWRDSDGREHDDLPPAFLGAITDIDALLAEVERLRAAKSENDAFVEDATRNYSE